MAGKSMIDFENVKWGMTGPKYIAAACALLAIGAGYTRIATTEYVDDSAIAINKTVATLAESQMVNAKAIADLTADTQKQKKQMGIVVRLVTAQYLEAAEADAPRARRSSRSRPANKGRAAVAKALQLDPDDPLAGLELSGVME
ncbi:MAG: hypothetical protein HRU00_09900 [Myxococcales bacterium]|nr:hypothetical protein [Myxococcales bacterium]